MVDHGLQHATPEISAKRCRGTHVIDDAIPVQRDQEPTATGGVDILEGKVLQQWSTPQPNCVLLCTV